MMKKIASIFVLALVAGALGLQAQSLKDNSYYQRSLELKAMAEKSFDDGDYDSAAGYAAQSGEYASLSDQFVAKMVAKAEADRAIGNAKARLAWADSIKASSNFPAEYAVAKGEMEASLSSYGIEEYPLSRDHARAVLAALESVREIAEVPPPVIAVPVLAETPPLPATYTVRLIPERRDCLWRIAEYPFIYNNPLKWPVIYEANKKTFRDPNNPNLIFPGQVLKIPAIKGEAREGEWDAAKEYVPLPKK
jgi:nucleoid-associated protein YgaU